MVGSEIVSLGLRGISENNSCSGHNLTLNLSIQVMVYYVPRSAPQLLLHAIRKGGSMWGEPGNRAIVASATHMRVAINADTYSSNSAYCLKEFCSEFIYFYGVGEA